MSAQPINTLAIWLPMNADELLVKQLSEGYRYTTEGIEVASDKKVPVYRYAKNYTKKIDGVKQKFSLCFITTDSDMKRVEDWLDKQSKSIKEIPTAAFTLTGVKYKQ